MRDRFWIRAAWTGYFLFIALLIAAVLEGALRPLGIQPPLHRRRMDFFRKSFAFSLEEASALGYRPRVGLDEGMEATARWYMERGLVSPGG